MQSLNLDSESKLDQSLEINIHKPSSPLLPLNIHNFVKDVQLPIETKIETNNNNNNNNNNNIQLGGTNSSYNVFDYFKSFFHGISHQTVQKKKHDTQNKSYLNSLFYSGNAPVPVPTAPVPTASVPTASVPTAPVPTASVPTASVPTAPVPVPVPVPATISNDVQTEPKEEEESEQEQEQEQEQEELTKIILTTGNPEIVLRESLKGTKLYYLAERTTTDLPSQWV